MLKIMPLFFIILCLTISNVTLADKLAPSITNYRVIFTPGYTQAKEIQVAIRAYQDKGVDYFLVVDPYTLATKIEPAKTFKQLNADELKNLQNTPYLKALHDYSLPPYSLENYGVKASEFPVEGVFLTIDMCPSRKFFEEDFFKKLVTLSDKKNQPIPITLAVSGRWMTQHPEEFKWLIDQQKKHKLAITWMNHSYTHVYYPNLPYKHNFMLLYPGDFYSEIIKTEKILLQHEQVPSVFFRFPGLVSDQNLVLKLKTLGLIPVGSNAWLAKGENPQNGSIILIHGNSNEHPGIMKMIDLMHKQEDIHFLPLNNVFGGGVSK